MTTGTFTAVEQADIEKDKQLSSAFIGYAKYNVLSNKDSLSFQRWNDHELLAGQVKKLVTSFMVEGVN